MGLKKYFKISFWSAILGVIAGLFLAKKSGKELAQEVKEKAGEIKEKAEEIADKIKEKAEETTEEIKETLEEKE